MNAPIRLYPGDACEQSPDDIAASIMILAGRYARLMGSSATAALLANLSRTHHLRSVRKVNL
jgi:hypothetical protein